MYFINQIRTQFLNQIFFQFEDAGNGIRRAPETQKEKKEPKLSGPDDAKRLLAEAKTLGSKMEKKGPNFEETGRKLKGENLEAGKEGKQGEVGKEKMNETPSVTMKEALSTVRPQSADEQKMAEMMHKNGENPMKIQEAIFNQRLEKIENNELSPAESETIKETLLFDQLAKEIPGMDAKVMKEIKALGLYDTSGSSAEETIAKIRESAGEISDVMDFAKSQGYNAPKTKEEFIALNNLYVKENGGKPVEMTPDEIAKLPKDEQGNLIIDINSARVEDGKIFKPQSASTRYEGSGVGTSYGNGKSGSMEGVPNMDSSELMPFVDKIASKLNVEPAAVKAIVSVESAGKINATRFEPHIKVKADAGKYGPGDRTMLSTSYGAFQIMGFNYKVSGFNSVEEFVEGMKTPEGQMDAFAGFIQGNPRIHRALQSKDWPTFAHGYNGPAYKQNNYDNKMAAAYSKYSSETPKAMV